MRKVNIMKGSWRTSVLGIIAVVTALTNAASALFDNDPATLVDLDTTITAVTAGLGLIFARDNKVSSEDVGAN